jgi:hypothetical protein
MNLIDILRSHGVAFRRPWLDEIKVSMNGLSSDWLKMWVFAKITSSREAHAVTPAF